MGVVKRRAIIPKSACCCTAAALTKPSTDTVAGQPLSPLSAVTGCRVANEETARDVVSQGHHPKVSLLLCSKLV
jgi:hypothetical protein